MTKRPEWLIARAKGMMTHMGMSSKTVARLTGIPESVLQSYRKGTRCASVPADTSITSSFSALVHEPRD